MYDNYTVSRVELNTSSSGPEYDGNDIFGVYDIERSLGQEFVRDWFRRNWTTPYFSIFLYMLVAFGGQRLMKDRKRFELRNHLAVWNFFLATFSWVATSRLGPKALWVLINKDVYTGLCNTDLWVNDGVATTWGFFFTLSKILEFGDTVFIVLRKQKLIFLHWYHHVTVLLFTWYNFSHLYSVGACFAVINLVVHSVMYTYFFFKALGYRIPRGVSMSVTTLQLIQMFCAVGFTTFVYLTKRSGARCDVPWSSIWMAFGMYISYAVLFSRLFYEVYISKAASKLKKDGVCLTNVNDFSKEAKKVD